MALKIRFSIRAIADLDEIRAYLVPRSPMGADRIRAQIDLTIDGLAEMPGIGRRTHLRGIRSAVVKRYPYIVYYRVADGEILILHIRHGARAAPAAVDLL